MVPCQIPILHADRRHCVRALKITTPRIWNHHDKFLVTCEWGIIEPLRMAIINRETEVFLSNGSSIGRHSIGFRTLIYLATGPDISNTVSVNPIIDSHAL